MVGRAHIRAAALGGFLAAAVGAGGVVLLPLVTGARPNPVKEQALLSLTRSVEAQAQVATRSQGAVRNGSGETEPLASAPAANPAGSAEPVPAPKAVRSGRSIEDLPAVSPIAYRPLRVEELPESPGSGKRGRRAKGAAGAVGPAAVASADGAGRALRIEDLPSVSAAVRPLRNDELNPELVKKADDLLWNHPSPVGVDVPFDVNGKSYVARFAYHYHEFGGAKKPWGYHKGVTLYSTAE